MYGCRRFDIKSCTLNTSRSPFQEERERERKKERKKEKKERERQKNEERGG